MRRMTSARILACTALLFAPIVNAHMVPELTAEQAVEAGRNYQQYCALCHGENRQGHVNDHAPSLRSKSLLETGFPERTAAIAYGRLGTPMPGFLDEIGGPMSEEEIGRLARWLNDQEGIEVPRPGLPIPIQGDTVLGAKIYDRDCSECHGSSGEGVTGTALGNPAMLSMTSDAFLRHAIVNGRQETEMAAFGEHLSDAEIDAVTAYIRSRATGWSVQKPVLRKPPAVGSYVINPDGAPPNFELKDDRYVLSSDLYDAIQNKRRMVILDTRVMSLWQLSHIEGSVPLPYYYERETLADIADDLPRDGTWIVTYCECPRAAAEFVNAKLVDLGFENTAVLWEGAFGWVGLGYPVSRGDTSLGQKASLSPSITEHAAR